VSSFWLILKQQWTIKISSPLFSIFSLAAILVGSRDHRTQFWKGAIQGPFHQSLVQIGPVASEELIKMWKVNGRTTDNGRSVVTIGSGELKTIIWPWGQRSRSNEGHYGTRHTALWSCINIPNIIDLHVSWKTKKLWSGQASLRRSRRSVSRRKNQTKTICLPSFEGET
jgi:hypothetical protein